MKITECRVSVPPQRRSERFLAYASLTLDDLLAVHDIKVIAGDKGPFISMPSRQVTEPCPECGHSVPVLDLYCGRCGKEQPESARKDKPWLDLIHPIRADGRRWLTEAVLAAYRAVLAPECESAEVNGHGLDLEEP